MNNISYDKLPPHMVDGARRYIEHGIMPGGFMMAVLDNDLGGAFARADEVNTAAMKQWAMWLYNDAPGGCWGSPRITEAWMEHEGLKGRRHSSGGLNNG